MDLEFGIAKGWDADEVKEEDDLSIWTPEDTIRMIKELDFDGTGDLGLGLPSTNTTTTIDASITTNSGATTDITANDSTSMSTSGTITRNIDWKRMSNTSGRKQAKEHNRRYQDVEEKEDKEDTPMLEAQAQTREEKRIRRTSAANSRITSRRVIFLIAILMGFALVHGLVKTFGPGAGGEAR